MMPLTQQAHELVAGILTPGETAVDATAGNGHDTVFLAQCVGSDGMVFAFDAQREALRSTAARLDRSNLRNVILRHCDHAQLADAVSEQHRGHIGAVMFNLGYLPGGDKSITTRAGSTLAAIRSALAMLRPGGIVTVLAYTGHPGGLQETQAVGRLLDDLPSRDYDVGRVSVEFDRPAAPRLFAVYKR